jgi:pimeloyl-ACP methyl ester carboxylesterase
MDVIVKASLWCALALCWSASWGQDSMSKCVDRLASAEGGATSALDRVQGMRYSCVQLPSGRHILVAQAGDATKPAVLLIHGMGDNAHRDWRATVPALTTDFRVVAVDLPGFGASEMLAGRYSFAELATALEGVTAGLQLRRLHVVGHSLGGAVSLYFAHRRPELVDRLVLVDVAGLLLRPVFLRHLMEANAASIGLGSLDSLFGILDQRVPGSSERMLDMLEDQSLLGRMIVDTIAARGSLFGNQTIADAAVNLVEHDFTAAVREVRVPTTIIWGSDDPITPLRTGKLLAARMPDAELQIVSGAQHMPMIQRPTDFNPILLRALTQPHAGQRPAPIPSTPQGKVQCLNQPNMRYTGVFEGISLQGCNGARIENARVKSITVEQSSLSLENVTVEGGDTALRAVESSVTATAGTIAGQVAIRADASRIDLAGVELRAQGKGVEVQRPSRIYFSLSQYDAADYRGAAHFVWPPPLK